MGGIQLKEKYDYIIVVDDDTLLTKKIDFNYFCNEFWSNKKLLGNRYFDHEIAPKVINSCMSFFSRENQDVLKRITNGYYLWYNQLSIYKSSTIDKFLKVTGLNNSLSKMNFYTFDYYLYMFYLLLFENFTIQDIEANSLFGIYESLGQGQIKYVNKKLLVDNCIQATEYMTKSFELDPIFLIHIDREYSPEKWFSKIKKYIKSKIK